MDQHTAPTETITRNPTAARYTRRRLLGMTAAGAGVAILAACGGSSPSAPATTAATSTGGAKVVITTPTSAAAPASGGAVATSGSGTSASAPAGSASASGRTGLKGKITIARQPAAPLSNGKDDPSNIVFQQLLDRYQKEHPGVTIEWIRVPGSSFDQLTQWITTRQASKNVPILSGHFSSTTSAQEASNTSPWIPMTPYLEANSAYTGKPWKQDFPEGALAYIQGSLKQIYYVTLNAYKAAWLYNKPSHGRVATTGA